MLWNDIEFWRKISWKHTENSSSERVDFNIFWGSTRPGPPRSSHLWRSRHLPRLFSDPLSNQCHHLTKQINHVFVHKTSYKWQSVLPCVTKNSSNSSTKPMSRKKCRVYDRFALRTFSLSDLWTNSTHTPKLNECKRITQECPVFKALINW